MKKLLLLSLFACAILSPLTMMAQKKKQQPKKEASTPLVLKTKADSISYAFGASMVQNGLTQHLTQLGVLSDTMSINESYLARIEAEENETKKKALLNELNLKIDSVKKGNSKNITEFLQGFSRVMNQDQEKSAFNTGMAIAGQLSPVKKNFSTEILGSEGEFNTAAFIAAFTSSLRDERLIIFNTAELMQAATQKAQLAQDTRQDESLKSEYTTQIAEGEKFMAENKVKNGVVTLPSGLQYKIIEQGTGEVPKDGDRVTVHYQGTLLDGTVFDSSIARGQPATLGVNQVIKGWIEALKLMPVGSKWELYIPYDLAYGSRNQGAIKPFSNLIFEVELIKIED